MEHSVLELLKGNGKLVSASTGNFFNGNELPLSLPLYLKLNVHVNRLMYLFKERVFAHVCVCVFY